ncbi:MAG: peptidoglycan editing factor PgeF [Bacteroidetes bacterium]|nr:MAG: peptidoglycan editing factor PgeF [Bacteroidota bacterium]
MESTELAGVKLYEFSNLKNFGGIKHFITSRKGGFSKGPFATMNTGFHVGDNDWDVLQNRKKLASMVNVNINQFTFSAQTHSSNIAIVDKSGKGKGSTESETAILNTDALICRTPEIFICVQTADCVPLILFDPVNRAIAAIHAGWRGTLKKITEATVLKMMHTFETHPADLIAGIGPSNGPCCYEVGEDVFSEVKRSMVNPKDVIKPASKTGKYMFDQWRANYIQLTDLGVKPENIETAAICSQCQSDLFFSSRKDNGFTGRTTSGIMITKPTAV